MLSNNAFCSCTWRVTCCCHKDGSEANGDGAEEGGEMRSEIFLPMDPEQAQELDEMISRNRNIAVENRT